LSGFETTRFVLQEIAESLSLNETSIGTFVARARQEFVRHYGKIGRQQIL
jgi:hypothetical protein